LRAFIGLGSNVGDRLENLRSAVVLLAFEPAIEVKGVSSVYETEAQDDAAGQCDFYNAVVEVETELTPRDLLAASKRIERELGREPASRRHAPRPIDLDLLLVEGLRVADDDLVVPHPELERRRFVLAPLLELAPDLPYADALAAVGGQRVTRIDARL